MKVLLSMLVSLVASDDDVKLLQMASAQLHATTESGTFTCYDQGYEGQIVCPMDDADQGYDASWWSKKILVLKVNDAHALFNRNALNQPAPTFVDGHRQFPPLSVTVDDLPPPHKIGTHWHSNVHITGQKVDEKLLSVEMVMHAVPPCEDTSFTAVTPGKFKCRDQGYEGSFVCPMQMRDSKNAEHRDASWWSDRILTMEINDAHAFFNKADYSASAPEFEYGSRTFPDIEATVAIQGDGRVGSHWFSDVTFDGYGKAEGVKMSVVAVPPCPALQSDAEFFTLSNCHDQGYEGAIVCPFDAYKPDADMWSASVMLLSLNDAHKHFNPNNINADAPKMSLHERQFKPFSVKVKKSSLPSKEDSFGKHWISEVQFQTSDGFTSAMAVNTMVLAVP